MKRYQNYKDSKVTWTDPVPSHWKQYRMKNIGYLYGGLSGKKGEDFKSEDDGNCKPFIPFTNVANNNQINISKFQYVVITPGEEQNLTKQGDLFFMMSSENYDDVGKTSVLLQEVKEVYLNSFCRGFRITHPDVDSLYLNFLLHSNSYRKRLMVEANGFTRINLKTSKVNDLQLFLPPLDEQVQIAYYLDHKTAQIDKLVSDKERLIELLNEERTAIINQAVTKGIDPDAPMRDSGVDWLGEVPEHWSMKRIKNVVKKVGSGVTPKGGAEVYLDSGVPLLRSQNVYFDGFRLDEVAYISPDVHNSMVNSKVFANDILLNITGGSIGRCYYVTNEFEEANVNQHVCIIRPNELILTKFLYNYLRSESGQLQIDICQIGGNRESVNFEQLKNFNIPLPDTNEQHKIVEFIDTFERKIVGLIEKTKAEISLLKEYKTALISEVVTGKVDVRNEVIPETENLNLAS